jgi:hypothetical protein
MTFMVEFSVKGYKQLLTAFTDEGYTFCGYDEIDAHLAKSDPFVVLRHDIDISLHPALQIARIEQQLGIQATYFVLLRSPFYNALSQVNLDIMAQIRGYGHQIATHVDLNNYDNDCAKALAEIDLFARCFPDVNTELLTLHSPYELERIPVQQIAELNRVYGSAVRGEVAYISDSTGRWRYGQPLDSAAFKAHKPIQLLTHPVWWIQEGETPSQKLDRWLYADYGINRAALRNFLPKLFKLDEPSS